MQRKVATQRHTICNEMWRRKCSQCATKAHTYRIHHFFFFLIVCLLLNPPPAFHLPLPSFSFVGLDGDPKEAKLYKAFYLLGLMATQKKATLYTAFLLLGLMATHKKATLYMAFCLLGLMATQEKQRFTGLFIWVVFRL